MNEEIIGKLLFKIDDLSDQIETSDNSKLKGAGWQLQKIGQLRADVKIIFPLSDDKLTNKLRELCMQKLNACARKAFLVAIQELNKWNEEKH